MAQAIASPSQKFSFTSGLVTVELKPDNFARAYSGKIGCMCGCKGTYTEEQKKITARMKNACQAATDGEATEIEIRDQYVYIASETGRCWCFYYPESPTILRF